jgi:hypothetical protein
MTAINGFDSAGHYLRAGLLLNTCSTYAIEKTIGCEATFTKAGAALRADAGAGIGKRALKGDQAGRSADADAGSGDQPISMPSAVLPGSTPAPTPNPTPTSGAPATAPEPATTTSTTTTTTTTTTAPAPAEGTPSGSGSSPSATDATGRLLDYLLGGGQ